MRLDTRNKYLSLLQTFVSHRHKRLYSIGLGHPIPIMRNTHIILNLKRWQQCSEKFSMLLMAEQNKLECFAPSGFSVEYNILICEARVHFCNTLVSSQLINGPNKLDCCITLGYKSLSGQIIQHWSHSYVMKKMMRFEYGSWSLHLHCVNLRCFTWIGFNPTHNYQADLEKLGIHKCTNLFCPTVSDEEKFRRLQLFDLPLDYEISSTWH